VIFPTELVICELTLDWVVFSASSATRSLATVVGVARGAFACLTATSFPAASVSLAPLAAGALRGRWAGASGIWLLVRALGVIIDPRTLQVVSVTPHDPFLLHRGLATTAGPVPAVATRVGDVPFVFGLHLLRLCLLLAQGGGGSIDQRCVLVGRTLVGQS